MKIYELETPCLIVDKNVFENNSKIMMDAIKNSRAGLRPHFKSHKCTSVSKFQLENGAIGLTCAKLSEAEAIFNANIKCNVLIANQIVEKSKILRLANLCKNNDIIVCVDSIENVLQIQSTLEKVGSKLGVLIEFDIGMERCGVTTKEEFYALYKVIKECKNLEFLGIQAYAGHNSHEVSDKLRTEIVNKNNEVLLELISYLNNNGVEIKIVSGASTGTCFDKMNEGIYNEIQAGSYLFLDDCYNKMKIPFKNSLFVLTTVVSKRDNLTVVDAGVKTVGIDQGLPSVKGATYDKIVASEEHFQIHNLSKEYKLQDKLLLIPGHCCSTNNLHDKLYFVDGDEVLLSYDIDGRGIGK